MVPGQISAFRELNRVLEKADALAAVVSFMQPSWNFSFIPMAAYAIAERKVKVMSEKKGKDRPRDVSLLSGSLLQRVAHVLSVSGSACDGRS